MLTENLSKLGLSPSEIKVYLHLLKEGSNYPNKISSEAKINRTNVYEALDRLVSKGIISFIVKNKLKWFEAKKPEALFTLIKEKEDQLSITKKNISVEIKKLKKQINPLKNSLEANIFTGKKGLRTIFEDILETKKPISLIAANLQFKELFGGYFELWHKIRIQNKISQRSIFPKSLKSKLKQRKLLKYKFVDDKFTNPTTTIIYGDNCLLIQWGKEPLAIRINDKEITKSHLNYFEMLWES
jgi:HTH-type transcriptional regulator, sugar sensing transcriptional regulator